MSHTGELDHLAEPVSLVLVSRDIAANVSQSQATPSHPFNITAIPSFRREHIYREGLYPVETLMLDD
jgi:hypothetical protein